MGTENASPVLPVHVRIAFAHAAVEVLAERAEVDILHIKGAALDQGLTNPGRMSSDADVLVRPSGVKALVHAVREAGWVLETGFEAGSSFGHSATFHHPVWGHIDLHRHFPGLGPSAEAAFDLLWATRGGREIAGVTCSVPAVPAQAVILLLHAARSGGDVRGARDVEHVWRMASTESRDAILEWVDLLHAQLPFSILTGTLEDYRGHSEYDLWRVAATGGSRLEEWRARFRAARTWRTRFKVLRHAAAVNVDHLRTVRGRPVTWREIIVEFFARPVRGVREEFRRRHP